MKKLVLLLAVVFSVSLFSCGNAAKTETAADSAVVVVEEVAVAVDTVTGDTVVAVEAAAVEVPDSVAK